MSDIVSVAPQSDFSAIAFTRSASGHVQSPWWSYDWKRYNPDGPYQIGSHFHDLRTRSISAFAHALGLREFDIMVSVRENPIDGQLEWRCGTARPVQLPKRTISRLESNPSDAQLKLARDAARRGAALNAPKDGVIDV